MRTRSTVSEDSANPSFLRTMVTKKLRTECSFHPVAVMIAAIVVPFRCLSSARTVSCLVLGRLKAGPTFLRVAVLFGCVAGRAMALRMLLCDMMGSFRLRRHLRRHRRSPTVALSPAGRDPRPTGPRQHWHQDALFAAEVQSYLQGNALAGVNVTRIISEVVSLVGLKSV